MGKKRKEKEELPDITVANMDLEGMPWSQSKPGQMLFGRNGQGGHREKESASMEQPAAMEHREKEFTPKERREMAWIALKAGLLIGGVFAGAFFLFLLFCVFVWLR